MGSLRQTTEEITTLNMIGILPLAILTLSGYVKGDTDVLSSSAFSPQSFDNSVYNVEPIAYPNYDYEVSYSSSLQGEEDRQDVGLVGGVSLVVIGTAFAAALLGALVVPVLNAGMTRLMEFQIEFPEFELPQIVEKSDESESNDSPRMIHKKSKCVKLAEDAARLIEKKYLQ